MQPPARAGLAVVALALLFPTGGLASGEPISETEAIRLFLQESPRARMGSTRAEAVRAGLNAGTELSNPTVAYQIEDAAEVRDQFLTFQQALPVTGRRSLLRKRSDAAFDAARHLGERDLLLAVHDLRASFYDVLHLEAVVDALRRGEGSLEQVVAVLREQERAGESSGYDLIRAEQEFLALRLDRGEAEAALLSSRATFLSFFDEGRSGQDSLNPAGDLSGNTSLPSLGEAVALALAKRGDLLALGEESRRQELELRSAGRERFPEPVLSAGWKRVEAPGVAENGFVASLSVPLPLFSRGKNASARARAASGIVEIRREMLRREIRAEVTSAHARAEATRTAAGEISGGLVSRAAELREIAGVSYAEGETGIMELLDAHKSSLTTELRALDAHHGARRARIALDRATGEEVSP